MLTKCFSLGIILVKFSFRNIYKLIDRKSARLILFGITAIYLPPQYIYVPLNKNHLNFTAFKYNKIGPYSIKRDFGFTFT